MALSDLWLSGPTTLLSAVNTLMVSIGQTPVTALEPSQSAYADQAVVALNETDLLVQEQSFEANREYRLGLLMDPTTGFIYVPENTLRIDAAYSSGGKLRVSHRGDKLYHRAGHTFDFRTQGASTTTRFFVDGVFRLPWEDLPQHVRSRIFTMAAQLFQGRIQSSMVVDRIESRQVERALINFENAEDEADPQNSISGNIAVQMALTGGGRVWRRGSGYGDWEDGSSSTTPSVVTNPTPPSEEGEPYDFLSIVQGE